MAFPEAQEAAKHSLLGRMGQPEEIAATVVVGDLAGGVIRHTQRYQRLRRTLIPQRVLALPACTAFGYPISVNAM